MLVRATMLAFATAFVFSASALGQADPHHPEPPTPEAAGDAVASPDVSMPAAPAGCPPTAMMGIEAMPMMQMMQSMQLTQRAMMETMQLMQEQMQQMREESER
jgi:hypothetical protein